MMFYINNILTWRFNTQPRGGGCFVVQIVGYGENSVSTHSRAEAAARLWSFNFLYRNCSFNTQPRGGGCKRKTYIVYRIKVSFNTQPRGGGCDANFMRITPFHEFQHTAARRRLQTLF